MKDKRIYGMFGYQIKNLKKVLDLITNNRTKLP